MSDQKPFIRKSAGAFEPGPFEPGRIVPAPPEPVQVILERWWNEDPDNRYVECLRGQALPCCVRLYQITGDDPPFELVGEGEGETLEGAAIFAVLYFQQQKAGQK